MPHGYSVSYDIYTELYYLIDEDKKEHSLFVNDKERCELSMRGARIGEFDSLDDAIDFLLIK